ncbi:MAG: pilus assembly protein [Actinobacteria bacterium]|nr:pilus assembly protein [Actinomycetota bacterium]
MRPRDDGSAVVDFTLVSVLVIALFLVVLQLGVVLHTRNVMVAAAAEGARYAANADRTPEEGALRTRELLEGTFALDDLDVRPGPADGDVVEVVVEAPLPVVFLPVGPLRLTVRGHALEESR